MAANTLGQKATEAYTAAAALANPFTRRIAEAIANATNNNNKDAKASGGRGGRGGGGRNKSNKSDNNNDDDTRCSSQDVPFGFLDNMCGPMLRNFNSDLGGGDSGDVDDLTINERDERDRSSRGRSGGGGGGRGRDRGRSGGGRRPTSSYDYDDETMATDITGSYDEDDDTYDDDRRKSSSNRRGRDRKPRTPACDSPSEMSGAYSEFDDTTFGDAESSAYNYETNNKKDSGKKKKNGEVDEAATATTGGSEKLITQPLASGFAKRCYFTKAGIGRSTQHYEGLTLTGNTVLMLAAAMKLKGCPTICDEDLRRVEQTYPNQFSRLPDELLLSSGWRRISKYCHFSHKPLPDGVPFFHSRKRCHPNGGFYFLLCSAVGMTRLMDVEPLNKDALAVLQTDFPLTCEKAPSFLMEEPNEWTLVNKFCFFSGGPINVEEDVYYRAELGGTVIYMLAFLSPSLSPEELYRLKQPSGEKSQQQEDTGPLKSVAAVEEVESVYDLTERDFEDLKLYHLGPCRALPPYLLHPETWTKVLPPHFVAAREEALRIAQEYEGPMPAGNTNQAESAVQGPEGENPGSGYVELGQAGMPSSRGGNMPQPVGGPGGYPPQYPMQQGDPNAPYYPPPPGSGVGMDQAGYPPQHDQQQYGMPPAPSEMNYYYAPPGGYPPSQFQQPMHMSNPYGNPNMGAPSPDRSMGGPPQYNQNGPHQPYGNAQMADPHWRDVQEEGAFGSHLP